MAVSWTKTILFSHRFLICSFPSSRPFITFSFIKLLFPVITFFFPFCLPSSSLTSWITSSFTSFSDFFSCVFYGLLCLCTNTFDRPNLSAASRLFSWLSWFPNARKRSIKWNRKLFYSEKWISKLRQQPLLFCCGAVTPLVQTVTCTTSEYVLDE